MNSLSNSRCSSNKCVNERVREQYLDILSFFGDKIYRRGKEEDKKRN
jgi:hypothetical protein